MIKILSNWSNPGGSTEAYIDLCNLFNKNGIDCTFYGPHPYHLGRCKSKQIKNANELNLTRDDNLILHHSIPTAKVQVRKVILSCHEKHSFPIAWEALKQGGSFNWDKIHFITEEQRKWHSIFPEEAVVIGNVINLGFTLENKPVTGCAGVVGSVEKRKRTFESVQKAISDGFQKVRLFGAVHDKNYLNHILEKFGDKVEVMGFAADKKQIYSSIDKVYHLSRWEIACLVQGECKVLGIPFEGSEFCPDYPIWKEADVLSAWKQVLDL